MDLKINDGGRKRRNRAQEACWELAQAAPPAPEYLPASQERYQGKVADRV
ncbi:MAG: hypothetical protein ACYDB9_04350 [Gammaproteobacteria bacterium]